MSDRLTLSPAEAARQLGMSRDHFDKHVKPHLRVIASGRLRLIPVAELEAWVAKNAART